MITTLTAMSQTQRLTFTGQPGIVVKDTDLNRVFIMDGITEGGIPLETGPVLNGPTTITANTDIIYTIDGVDAFATVSVEASRGVITSVDPSSFQFTVPEGPDVTITLTVDGKHYPHVISLEKSGLEGQYTKLASGPSRRAIPGFAYIPETHEIHLVGGYDYAVSDAVGDHWVYSLNDGVWTQLPDYPGTPCQSPTMVSIPGGFLLIGGNFRQIDVGYTPVWYYDVLEKTWTERSQALYATEENRQAVAYFDGFVYLFGDGYPVGTESIFLRYDIGKDEWLRLPDTPLGVREAPYGFSLDGKFYTGGGYLRSENIYPNDMWVYDPVEETWTEHTNVLPGTEPYNYVMASLYGNIYFHGGRLRSNPELRPEALTEIGLGSASNRVIASIPPSDTVMVATTDGKSLFLLTDDGEVGNPGDDMCILHVT